LTKCYADILRSFIRTYCLLVSLLFVACLYPGSGTNSACAEVTDSVVSVPKVKGIFKARALAADTSATKVMDETAIILPDSAKILIKDTDSLAVYKPDPQKAIWYSALCPGLGQLYNRRYWKLPIVAAGIVGMAYGIGWNQKYYTAYTNAYRDISDDNPNTKSYLDLLSSSAGSYDTSQLTTILKNRQQSFRRSRDLSIIGAVGVYLVCLIDAYVDAQLYDFDISPDLSFLPQSKTPGFGGIGSIGLNLAFHF